MKPYLDLFLINTSDTLLEMPENFENFNKLFPKKHLNETVVSYRKQPKSRLFGTPDFLKNVVTHPVISGDNISSSVHETG